MQHVLQTGLSLGLSATSGFHSDKPHKVDPSFNGSKYILPLDYIPTADGRVTFKGKYGNIQVPHLSWGAWSWGDKGTWNWREEDRPGVTEGWELAKQHQQTFIDTAQAYGSGRSEEICGELVKGMPRDSYVMQTKWYVVPDSIKNLSADAPANYLKESLKRMGLDYVDVYMVHGHIHARSIASVAKSLADCVENKWAKVIAVANYNVEDMLHMQKELAQYGIPLAANQCEFSVLRRYPETHGMLDACRENGIVFQSYSSLAQGRLTGRYTAEHEPPKTYRFSSYAMKDLQQTITVLESIAKARKISTSAVTLNYNLSKGVMPVVGFRHRGQVEQNLEALGWRLSLEEMQRIDEVSLEGKATVLWQQD